MIACVLSFIAGFGVCLFTVGLCKSSKDIEEKFYEGYNNAKERSERNDKK